MKNAFITGLLAATATTTGLLAASMPASAAPFTWNNNWKQPEITKGFDHLPFQKFVQQETKQLTDSGLKQLDVSKLKLKVDHDVSIYFINEGAGFRNQLAYQTSGAMNSSGLAFKDISCKGPDCVLGYEADSTKKTLDLGDGVGLGKMTAGTQLDFWLRANGANDKNGHIFGTQSADNPDKLQHVVAYAYKNYIVLGFEDLYGELKAKGGLNQESDRDFNDTVFVLDIGKENMNALVPEPSMLLGLGGLAALGLKKRKNAKVEGIEA
jgi:Domain of unknown function (DUF4114)